MDDEIKSLSKIGRATLVKSVALILVKSVALKLMCALAKKLDVKIRKFWRGFDYSCVIKFQFN